MIWQLIKRDPALRWAPLLALGVCALLAVRHYSAPAEEVDPLIMIIFYVISLASLGMGIVYARDTPFLSILPLTVRQVMLSRVLSLFALQWLPMLAVAGSMAVFNIHGVSGDVSHQISLRLVRIWPVVSLLLLCSGISGDKGLMLPRSMKIFGWTWWLTTVAFVLLYIPSSGPFPDNGWAGFIGMLSCYVIGVVVFVHTWQAFPSSFQSAPPMPAGVSAARSETVEERTPRAAKMTLFRAVLPISGIVVPFLLTWMTRRNYAFVWALFSLIHWSAMRQRIRWLSGLPVRPRAILAAVVVPMPLALSAGYVLRLCFPWIRPVRFRYPVDTAAAEPGTAIVTIAVICAVSLLAMLIALLYDSHHLRRLSRNVRRSVVTLVLAGIVGAPAFVPDTFDPVPWVSRTLPDGQPGVIAIAGLTLAALCWGLDVLFRQMEFIEKSR